MENTLKEASVDYLMNIVKPMLENPADAMADVKIDERGMLLSLLVNKKDMGVVIGKDGETARAIRKLLKNFGLKYQAHISLKIDEPTP